MKIVLGSTSDQKKKYLLNVLQRLGIEADVNTSEVDSGIHEQPIGSDLVKSGAANRATRALKHDQNADLGLGIEIGYEATADTVVMLCWAVVMDKNGTTASAKSHEFTLPKYFVEKINRGEYLGEHVVEYYQDRANDPIVQRIGEIVHYRQEFIENALENALLHYFGKNEF